VEKSRENGGKGWKNDVTGVEERLEKLKTGEGKEVKKLGAGNRQVERRDEVDRFRPVLTLPHVTAITPRTTRKQVSK